MEVTLRAQEIYFLGKKVDGDHLNYQYIAAMPEISQRRAVIEQECTDALERSGVAEESLTGEFVVRPRMQKFLHPLYFSDYESELALDEKDTDVHSHYLFHHEKTEEGEQWLTAELDGEKVRLTSGMQDTVEGLLQQLGAGTGNGPMLSDAEIAEQATKALVLKGLAQDGTSLVVMYLLANGCWYEQTEQEMNRPVPPEEFRQEVRSILRGGEV